MLDVKDLREDLEGVKKALSKRNKDFGLDKFTELDENRRKLIQEVEELKNKQNTESKEIANLKQKGEDATKLLADMKELSDKIKELDGKLKEVEKETEELLLSIPNIPNEKVKQGLTDEDNEEMRKWGTPRKFSFEYKAHWDIGKDLDILDPETAAKTTGTRFTFYKGMGARLERAVMNFMMDTHATKDGYTETIAPSIVNADALQGTGQLPKFKEDMFKIENTNYYLSPTSEVPVTNMYREDIIDGKKLPLKYCCFTPCYRAEAGSAGRDTRGLVRQHQFYKVEMVKFTRPEQSYDELESLTNDAENILKLLDLPYRVVRLCSGDLGFSAAMTYDVEVWMPSYNRYVEISSCSNCEAFQARRAGIRFKDNIQDKAQYAHTLNGSGLAVGRTVAAILENYQNEDGSVTVPEVLVPYMLGVEVIK